MPNQPKTVRVAAVQVESRPGRVQENLAHAAPFVEQAARRGAALVLLPELLPGGYLLAESIWETAEPFAGPTTAWLAATARRLGIYLGATFAEAEGEDFYNTFALAAPTGEIAGGVRKTPPASLEAHFFRSGGGSHVIETPLARIGVAICYEGLLFERLTELYAADVELVLQPAAAGRPLPMRQGDEALFDEMICGAAPIHARALGAPVVYANRTGPLRTPLPGYEHEMVSCFPGLSRIVDGDGSLLAELGDEEGVVVADVHTAGGRKSAEPPQPYINPLDASTQWAVPVPWYAPMWPQTQADGERGYAANAARRSRAATIAAARQ